MTSFRSLALIPTDANLVLTLCNIGSNRLYEFCYLLPFDLWTSYLARILFLQGYGSLFWEFSSSTRIFNELQYNLQVARIH